MIEKRNTRGIISLIVMGVISFIIAIGLVGFFYFLQTGDNLYKQGNIFGVSPMKDKSTTSVKITGFLSDPIANVDGGTQLYLIEFSRKDNEDYGYTSLEIKEGDKLIDELKAKQDDLLDNPVYVLAKVRKSGADGAVKNYSIEFKDTIRENKAISQLAETEYYVSAHEANTDRLYASVGAGIAVLFGIVFFCSAYATRKREDKAYAELYVAYPELNYSMNTVLENATYVDNQLGIILYKNHLISTFKNFQVYDLSKADRIYH